MAQAPKKQGLGVLSLSLQIEIRSGLYLNVSSDTDGAAQNKWPRFSTLISPNRKSSISLQSDERLPFPIIKVIS